MTRKEDFWKKYFESRVTVIINIDKQQFVNDDNIIISEREVKLEQIGNYYCPWHYNIETLKTYEGKGFKEILGDPRARVVTIKDVGQKVKFGSKSKEIEKYIKDFERKTEQSLCPFPIATDTAVNKSLVLDGNKTLVALYQSWDKDKKIPIAEILGEQLFKIFPEFCIVYRG
jgi:hypothetical protein